MRAVILASVLATPAMGERLHCETSTMNCSPLVACIEETGEYFRGASFGQNAGPLQAVSVTGAICTGTAVGQGSFADGSIARFWVGNNLERYVRETDPFDRERMACNPADILLNERQRTAPGTRAKSFAG